MPSVYAVSDLHGNIPSVPDDAEVLLIAGDICPDFRPYGNRGGFVDTGGTQQARWLDTTFRAFLGSLQERGVEVVATWGNHDFVGQTPLWPLVKPMPMTMLVDQQYVTDSGLVIYGTPWVPGLPYWAFYGRTEALEARAELIPDGVDVLMTHGPPHSAGDFIPTSEKQRNKYGNYGGMNVGDPSLNVAIARAKPGAVICGHIHEDRGTHLLGDYVGAIHNVAAVDAAYNLHPNPCVKLHEF